MPDATQCEIARGAGPEARILGAGDQAAEPEIHPPERIVRLLEKYEALPMDLADATLVLLAEWLGHGRILSIERRDFGAYRWKERHPFENLLA